MTDRRKSPLAKKAKGIRSRPSLRDALDEGRKVNLVIHRKLPGTHPFYSLIGRVAAEWAALEHELDQIIWHLSGLEGQKGSCLTGQYMTYRQRMESIIALTMLLRFPEKTTEYLRKIMGILGDLSARRNRFVHDAWFVDLDNRISQFVSFTKNSDNFGFQAITEPEALDLIADIEQRRMKIVDLANRIRGEMPA